MRTDLSAGDTTGHLNLSDRTLYPNMYISVEGEVEFTEANVTISFTGYSLEIAAVKVSKSKLMDLYKIQEVIDLGEIDLGEDPQR